MSRARVAASAAVLIVSALTVAGCATEAPMPTPTPTQTFAVTGDGILRIGTLLPLSGAAEAQGRAQVAGVEAAVREVNLAGGVAEAPVEVFHRNGADAASVTAGFAALVARGVDVVVGPESPELVQLIAADAAAAGVLIVSTSIPTPASDAASAPMIVGLQPAGSAQGAELGRMLGEAEAAGVALVSIAVDTDAGLSEALSVALDDAGSELAVSTVVAPGESDFDELLTALGESKADAIVLTAPAGASAEVVAVVAQLADAGFTGDELWFTAEATVAYTGALPTGALEGAIGLVPGVTLPAAFVAALGQSDPTLPVTTRAGEAHDAVVLAALAAVVGDDDGGPALGRHLRSVSSDGIPCGSFAECLDVLTTEADIDLAGVSGALDLDEAGAVTTGGYSRVVYTADNAPIAAAE